MRRILAWASASLWAKRRDLLPGCEEPSGMKLNTRSGPRPATEDRPGSVGPEWKRQAWEFRSEGQSPVGPGREQGCRVGEQT